MSTNQTFWNLKLSAFLHDPPDKALDIRNHLSRAKKYYKIVMGDQDFETGYDTADHMASAVERVAFEIRDDDKIYGREVVANHPVSGTRLMEGTSLTLDQTGRDIAGILSAYKDISDPFIRFCRIWNEYPALLAENNPDYSFLPAETRLPDHSIWAHLDAAAAFAGLSMEGGENRPAFLSFSLGPVQGFIAASRRVQDLWASSYLLSWLAFRAMEPVLLKRGPDAILFPLLRGQPLFNAWLNRRQGQKAAPENLHLPSIPNKFTAIVPVSQAQLLAKACKEAVYNSLAELNSALKSEVPDLLQKELNGIEEQIRLFPEISVSVMEWPAQEGGGETGLKPFMIEFDKLFPGIMERDYGHFLNYARAKEQKYGLNSVSQLFGLIRHQSRFMADAEKHARRFEPWPGDMREKCTLCGEREAMGPGNENYRDFRKFWERVGAGSRIKKKEALCGVCLLKRYANKLLADKEGFNPGKVVYPSTAMVAVSDWKHKVLDMLKNTGPDREKTMVAVDALINGIIALAGKDAFEPVPADSLPDGRAGREGRFFNLNSDLLYANHLSEKWLAEEGYTKNAGQARKALNELSDICDRPPSYYAVLAMDGDDIGKWVSGIHENRPTYERAIPEAVREDLNKALSGAAAKLFKGKRVPGPAYQAALSRCLFDFGLRSAPEIVDKHHGILVYSGGDDVLALLPVTTAIDCAMALAQSFKTHMGGAATASAGLAVGHVHGITLGELLDEARHAEFLAKKGYGKNSLCLRIRKRSGECVEAGGKWESSIWQAGAAFRELRDNGCISSKYPYEAQAVFGKLLGVKGTAAELPVADNGNMIPKGMVLSELKRLWKRHWMAGNGDKEAEKAFDETLGKDKSGLFNDGTVIQDTALLIRTLLAQLFLSRKGGERA
ncbi:MAG: type III-B CRISPR-associated protein Cas10/Cmr2 [bacterium]